MTHLRQQLRDFLQFQAQPTAVAYTIHASTPANGYTRHHISYPSSEAEPIPAYLLLPDGVGPFPAVVVHHQHHGQRHLGKSEVCGLAGDPWQAFGPALAQRGIAVLAPDSICFEDRRRNASGTEPHDLDTMQHFNEMCYRLVQGDTLLRQVLDDSARAISLLQNHPLIDSNTVGLLGHSYGGSTTLFHAPLDERIRFAASSGAACSYQQRMADQNGIEMAQVVPGFVTKFDIADLVNCMAPRPLLIVSASDDKHSQDAAAIVQQAHRAYVAAQAGAQLQHQRYEGDHDLTPERFQFIVDWIVTQTN